MAIPSPSLFSNAANLEAFHFRSSSSQSLTINHFVFSNTASFNLPFVAVEQFHALQLLEFLKASPMLCTVRVETARCISLDNIHWNRVVVHPGAESLTLTVSDGTSGFKIVTHIVLLHKIHGIHAQGTH